MLEQQTAKSPANLLKHEIFFINLPSEAHYCYAVWGFLLLKIYLLDHKAFLNIFKALTPSTNFQFFIR